MAVLDIDVTRARAQASAVAQAGEELADVATNNMQLLLGEMQASWKGDAANRYLASCTQLIEDLREEAEALRDLSARINRAITVYEEQEREAERIAQERGGYTASGSNGGGTRGGSVGRF